MLQELQQIREKADSELARVESLQDLDAWRINYLGRKGELTRALRGIGQLPPEERPEAGRVANQIKVALETAYASRVAALEREALQSEMDAGAIDVRLPGRPQTLGYRHIITRVLQDVYAIFGRMGFSVMRTREVEDDMTNFQMLNFPPHHPARDMQDTFHTTRPGVLLRTHTSPGQIHAMRTYYPNDIRVILPGKCYRYEQMTARAEHMFYQVEGLAVGKNITMGNLKGVLTNFVRQMYGPERRLRFRASYFPFTEPSAEVDIDCALCHGEGCSLCKYTGWLEILGCGMVHPKVLRNGGYDPDVYSGFAFGMGPERIAMLKHSIDDIRLFYGNDLRFLHQFG